MGTKVDEQVRAAVATGDTAWLRDPDGDYWGYGLEQMAVAIETGGLAQCEICGRIVHKPMRVCLDCRLDQREDNA